ncbi:MAG: M23 family metallopeptidase [Saprospiraceae bacterium]
MKREKYVYNSQTLQYEKLKLTPGEKLQRLFTIVGSIVLSSAIIFGIAFKYFPTPKEQSLQRANQQMVSHFENLKTDFGNIAQDLNQLQKKDAEVHRMIFGIDPIDDAVWEGGIGGHKKYAMLENFGVTGETISESLEDVDKLKRKITLQRESLDMLFNLAKSKENKLASIPSIKPVVEDKLKRKIKSLSGFGIRLHPVHKVKKFHKGIDFTAPIGTDIQSTGDGKVIRVEKRKRGYGHNVIIDHGYGYTTLYGHMKTISVKKGELVKKGQKIGEIGNTGTSTAPHLHYEVRINGKAVNPIDYCLDGLSPNEYKELVAKASVENQSFD